MFRYSNFLFTLHKIWIPASLPNTQAIDLDLINSVDSELGFHVQSGINLIKDHDYLLDRGLEEEINNISTNFNIRLSKYLKTDSSENFIISVQNLRGGLYSLSN